MITSRKWWSPCLLWQRTSRTALTHTAWSGKTVQMASASSTSIPTALVDTGIFLLTSMFWAAAWSAERDLRVKMLFPAWVCWCFPALQILASSVCGGRNLMPHCKRGGIRILIRLTVSYCYWMAIIWILVSNLYKILIILSRCSRACASVECFCLVLHQRATLRALRTWTWTWWDCVSSARWNERMENESPSPLWFPTPSMTRVRARCMLGQKHTLLKLENSLRWCLDGFCLSD